MHTVCITFFFSIENSEDSDRLAPWETTDQDPHFSMKMMINNEKTYVMGTHKNLINETVLLSTKNIC